MLKHALPNFQQSRKKLSTANFSRSAPGTQALLAQTPLCGVMPLRGMPGAFCHGIVKNQQDSAAEALLIGSGEKIALPELIHPVINHPHKTRTSEFPTIP
jgi:hypothetical protein